MDFIANHTRLIVIIGLFACFIILRKTKFFWKIVGHIKWKRLQPELNNIREIHYQITVVGISKAERNKKKSSFKESRYKYRKYLDFCKSKGLSRPDNYAEFKALVDETNDALFHQLDYDLKITKRQYEEAFGLLEEAGTGLLEKRKEALQLILQIENLVNSISNRPKQFDASINEVILQRKEFKGKLEFGERKKKELESLARNAGTGAIAGMAIVRFAPKAAMWVATTFGRTSTGIAISGLSGAAATNAQLAWLGGGALAAGGGGMAAGQALLALAGPVGITVAGVSVLASVLFYRKRNAQINKEKENEIIRIKQFIEEVKESTKKIDAISIETSELYDRLRRDTMKCNNLEGQNYTLLQDEQKTRLGTIVNNAKALAALMNKTLET